jgi:hypothetical protein
VSTISHDELAELVDIATTASAGWADAVLARLNPAGLPPTLDTPEVWRLWEQPWLLRGADPDRLPRGWADEVSLAPVPEADRVAALALALAAATARRPDSSWEWDYDLRHLTEVASLALSGSKAAYFSTPLAVQSRGLREKFREVSPGWERTASPFWMTYWGTTPGGADAEIPLPAGGRWVVTPEDWAASDVGVPSVCPAAGVLPPVFQAGGLDALSRLDAELRQRGRLDAHQAVHWVGGLACLCECGVVRPAEYPWPQAATLELDLYRSVGELMAAVRSAAEPDRVEGRGINLDQLGQGVAALATGVKRPFALEDLGPAPEGVEWTQPVGVPLRVSSDRRDVVLSPAWVELWTRVRATAAANVLAVSAPGLLPQAQRAWDTPEAGAGYAPDLTGATAAVIDAYHALAKAAAAAEGLRQAPEEASVWFDGWLDGLVSAGGWGNETPPPKRGSTRQSRRADRTGVGPGPAASASDDSSAPYWDDGYCPDQPNMDWLVEQAAKVLEAVLRARAAYAAAQTVSPAAGAGGCAFRSALTALAPAATLCERVLGLTPYDPMAHGPTARLRVAGVRYDSGPPAIDLKTVPRVARRLPPVEPLLVAAGIQAGRAARLATGRAVRPGGESAVRPPVPEQLDARMFALAYHSNAEWGERFRRLTRKEWAELLGVTEAAVRTTRTWEGLLSMRDGSRVKRVSEGDAIAAGLTVPRRRTRR